jgi:hypothetical protein
VYHTLLRGLHIQQQKQTVLELLQMLFVRLQFVCGAASNSDLLGVEGFDGGE